MSSKQKLPSWNITEYYKSITDPQIKKDQKSVKRSVLFFEKQYRNKIKTGTISPKKLLAAIKKLESIERKYYQLAYFASYMYDTDMNNEKKASFNQAMDEMGVEISKQAMFFSLEIKQIPNTKMAKYLKSPDLDEYKYFLKETYKFKTHTLSEAEEAILVDKQLPARQAWQRLNAETTANLEVSIKEKKIGFEKALSLLMSADRKTRQNSLQGISDALKDNRKVYTHIFNNLLLDKQQTDKLRKYDNPCDSRLLSEDINISVVDTIEEVVVASNKVSAKHYDNLKKVLGYKELFDYDRYAPLNFVKTPKISYLHAKKTVLGSFKDFDLDFYNKAKQFFDNNWIDVPPKKGKRGGTYCSFGTDKKNPRILLNFTSELGDILTMSHELGHGIHDLYAKKNSLFNMHTAIPMAEIASIFCENITFDHLLENTKNDKLKLQLLSDHITDITKTVHRQMAFHRFEKQIHSERKKGELSSDQLDSMFQKEMQAMFGKSLKLTDNHRNFWQYVSHFVNSPFYVYSYVFGGLISLALYNKYKEAGSDQVKKQFIKQYKEMLSMGGSASPADILKTVGVNINDKKFWQGGVDIIKEKVRQEQKLIQEIK